jgi:hypothetical protein
LSAEKKTYNYNKMMIMKGRSFEIEINGYGEEGTLTQTWGVENISSSLKVMGRVEGRACITLAP